MEMTGNKTKLQFKILIPLNEEDKLQQCSNPTVYTYFLKYFYISKDRYQYYEPSMTVLNSLNIVVYKN